MACRYLDDQQWRRGDMKTTFALNDSISMPVNYFTCGTYYFDGMFDVVDFPEGMTIYHGSYPLLANNSEFPLGKDFYDPTKGSYGSNLEESLTEEDSIVDALASDFTGLSPGWFADLKTAKLYSRQTDAHELCEDKCILAYKLKKDTTFIVLDSPNNLVKLKNMAGPDIKKSINEMFSLIDDDYGDITEVGKVNLHKYRVSFREFDIPFTRWLCKEIQELKWAFDEMDYAGYAANTQPDGFHMEIAICNPAKYLQRDLSNKHDLQFNPFQKQTPYIISKLMKQMALYKSTNVNFHAGDLLQHSIWTLLFSEKLTSKPMIEMFTNYVPSDAVRERVAALAFIHDIGKMAPEHTRIRKHDMVYFAIVDHPEIGSDYVLKTKQLPTFYDNLKFQDFFNMDKLLETLKLSDYVRESAKIVRYHWDLGDKMKNISSGMSVDAAADEYIDLIGSESPEFYFTLISVSAADILASQPFGVSSFETIPENPRSEFFPYISNVPKLYRGGVIARDNLIENGFALMGTIMSKVSGVSFTLPSIKPILFAEKEETEKSFFGRIPERLLGVESFVNRWETLEKKCLRMMESYERLQLTGNIKEQQQLLRKMIKMRIVALDEKINALRKISDFRNAENARVTADRLKSAIRSQATSWWTQKHWLDATDSDTDEDDYKTLSESEKKIVDESAKKVLATVLSIPLSDPVEIATAKATAAKMSRSSKLSAGASLPKPDSQIESQLRKLSLAEAKFLNRDFMKFWNAE